MKILTNKQYDLFLAQQRRIDQLQKDNDKLRKENDKLKSDINALIIENGILNNSMTCSDIDFPNSQNRSSDLYDPIDKLF